MSVLLHSYTRRMTDDYWSLGRTLSTKAPGSKLSEYKSPYRLNKTVYGLVLSIRGRDFIESVSARTTHTWMSVWVCRSRGRLIGSRLMSTDSPPPCILLEDFSHLFWDVPVDRAHRKQEQKCVRRWDCDILRGVYVYIYYRVGSVSILYRSKR